MNQVPSHPRGIAFLLSQLGARVSARFAERIRPLGLTPPDAAVLRVLGGTPAPLSQRELAARLGLVPSRVVALVDSLQTRGLVTRETSEVDRRRNEVSLTGAGQEALAGLRNVALDHEAEFIGHLSPQEADQLAVLLRRTQQAAHLPPGSHPGMGR